MVTQEGALLLQVGGNRTRKLSSGQVGGMTRKWIRNDFPEVCGFPGGASQRACVDKSSGTWERRWLSVRMGQWVERSESGLITGKPRGEGDLICLQGGSL